MDWPNVEEPFLGEKEESFFDYVEAEPTFEADPELASRALSRHGDTTNLKLSLHWKNMGENWDQWRSSLVLSRDLTQKPLNEQESASGYHILLSARVLPVQVAPLLESLNSLPFLPEDWRRVTSRFYLHNAVCEPMLDTLLSSYTTYLVKDYGHETLDMFTAVMSSDYEDFIAVSSTYFRKSRVTAAVVYGSNKKQMDHVERLLDNSPEVKSHPLLMIGVFEELQRKRLNKLHTDAGTEFVDIIIDLDLSNPKKAELSQHHNTWLRDCRTRIRKLQEETRVAQCQLEKMIDQVKELKSQPTIHGLGQQPKVEWPGIELMADTNRYLRRFKDICLEYEGMVAIYQLWSDELAFTRELFMSEMAREAQDAALNEAKESRHQAKAATVLAFVAMVYLPSTTVATIFAMPIFDWKARWWNFYGAFVAQLSTDESSSTNQTSTDPGPKPVLSGYFWIYLAVSLFLTFLTVIICFFYISDWNPVINFFSSIWTAMNRVYVKIKTPTVGGGGGDDSEGKSTEDEKPVARKGTPEARDGTPLTAMLRTATAERLTSTEATSTLDPPSQGPVASSDLSSSKPSPPQGPVITPSPSPGASLLSPTSTSTAHLLHPPLNPSPLPGPPTRPPGPEDAPTTTVQDNPVIKSPASSKLARSAAKPDSTNSPAVTSTSPATVPVSISQASPKEDTSPKPQGSSLSTFAKSTSTAAQTS